MNPLQEKIDFVSIVSVIMANPNGESLSANRPRQNSEGYGIISDVCSKRKLCNRMQDMGYPIFLQAEDRCDDGAKCLAERAEKAGLKDIDSVSEFQRIACEKWLDARTFGRVFAFNSLGLKSVGIRGPVTIREAISVSPVEIEEMQITKSATGEFKKKDSKEKKSGESESVDTDGQEFEGKRGSDTMGMKSFVKFGLYLIKGSINVQLAEKTGFSEEDAEVVKECLRTMFVNDASAARPEGSMEVIKLIWWKHNCKDGQYSTAKVHRSVHVKQKDTVTTPTSADDYIIEIDKLPGLEPEIIDGV